LENYFSSFLFRWVRAGQDKNCSQSIPLEKALTYKYIDPNNRGYIRVLTIDIDWNIPLEDYIDLIPLPNIISANPENGHLQIMYLLKDKVYLGNAKIMYAFKMVKNSLNRILQADFGFTGRLQKNPLHPAWNTTWFNNDPYHLSELIDWSMQQEFDVDSHYDPDPTSRHMTIFDALRKYAYRHNKNLIYDDMESHAKYLNSLCPEFGTILKSPLDIIELRSIVNSIWRFMQNRYTGEGGSGNFSEDHRKKSIENRISKKWRNIRLFIEYRKMKLDFKTISDILRVTVKTIKNYALTLQLSPSLDPNSPNLSNPSSCPNHSSQHSYDGYAKQHGYSHRSLPPVLPMITNTVFHRISDLMGRTDAMLMKLEPNTS
jgi:hypothetical protein